MGAQRQITNIGRWGGGDTEAGVWEAFGKWRRRVQKCEALLQALRQEVQAGRCH